ncbi:phage tail protein [Pseudomonas sp. 22-AL-CL-001]|uniref:phage tail protein n=1 Tax=Pseudomonas alabamensis TaxID=3064349 RepID=UPI00271373E3|nr:phage tail protein [Pseudomonas sp. 22-AL-CL-001]MDO7911332.1 phage tail protein [Pseudomonas sp. 22-AL-CL-001]
MAERFTWKPNRSAPGTFQNAVRSANFGNGYRQVAGDGINNETQSWNLTFTGKKARIAAILAFLRAQRGYKPFIWKTPFDGDLYFTCNAYSPTDQGGDLWMLTATFEQTHQVT